MIAAKNNPSSFQYEVSIWPHSTQPQRFHQSSAISAIYGYHDTAEWWLMFMVWCWESYRLPAILPCISQSLHITAKISNQSGRISNRSGRISNHSGWTNYCFLTPPYPRTSQNKKKHLTWLTLISIQTSYPCWLWEDYEYYRYWINSVKVKSIYGQYL